jgi:AraC-like DNA-binding protein
MPVHLHLPGPPLDLFVENFWSVMQHPSPWTKERILPDGGLEMIFNLGEPQRLHIVQAAGVDWAEVAYGCGYHDQSHFVYEFVHFTQLTPTEYLSRRGEYLNYVRVD